MRIVLQRVSEARVLVDQRVVGQIGRGLLLLVGMEKGDQPQVVKRAAAKVASLRLFADPAAPAEHKTRMNLGVGEIDGEVLVISQFTLAANTNRGRRPSFDRAMPPDLAREQIDKFVRLLREQHRLNVAEGEFGAMMQVELVNQGPVTLVLDF